MEPCELAGLLLKAGKFLAIFRSCRASAKFPLLPCNLPYRRKPRFACEAADLNEFHPKIKNRIATTVLWYNSPRIREVVNFCAWRPRCPIGRAPGTSERQGHLMSSGWQVVDVPRSGMCPLCEETCFVSLMLAASTRRDDKSSG